MVHSVKCRDTCYAMGMLFGEGGVLNLWWTRVLCHRLPSPLLCSAYCAVAFGNFLLVSTPRATQSDLPLVHVYDVNDPSLFDYSELYGKHHPEVPALFHCSASTATGVPRGTFAKAYVPVAGDPDRALIAFACAGELSVVRFI